MSSNRISKANTILDMAEKEFLKDKDKQEILDAISKTWNVGNEVVDDIYKIIGNHLDTLHGQAYVNFSDAYKKNKLANIFVGVVNANGNYMIVDIKGEDKVEKYIGLGTDLLLVGVQFTPIGRVLNLVNIPLTLAGIDFSTIVKNQYKKRFLGYDVEDISLTSNGFLKVTMKDGTVYSRPLFKNAQGLVTGNTKDDVLFGSSKNDTLQGGSGYDILIGGDGFDKYNVSGGDIIKDSDGKGAVYFHGKLTGGKAYQDNWYMDKQGNTYYLDGSTLTVYSGSDTITKKTSTKTTTT